MDLVAGVAVEGVFVSLDGAPCYTMEVVIPAKSGYPVRCGFSILSLRLWNAGSPAFAGDDVY